MTAPYVMAIRVSDLFADSAYQRDADPSRVRKMVAEFDPRLLGVIDVSKRPNGRYAILDGQHRHALVREVRGSDEPMVCQVYEGLSVDEEARLFHEINVRRKALNFWDRWKARRASGDERVRSIEDVLAGHGLKVYPGAGDGNIAATAALEIISQKIGDDHLLDSVVEVLLGAFGKSREAFEGSLMQGVALVLANYPPDELDRTRLVRQLSELPIRQLRARAQGLREMHKGTLPRLIGAVVVDQYNRGAGRRVEPFFTRVPAGFVRQPTASPSPPAAPAEQAPAPTRPGCRCGHSHSDHAGELAPQCHAKSCTCILYRPLGAIAKAG